MRPGFALLVAFVVLPAPGSEPWAAADPLANPVGSRMRHRVVELATGLANPWSLAFTPDGAALITERAGHLRVFRNGMLEPAAVAGVPAAFTKGDGGLLGLAVDPRFEINRRIFICLAMGEDDANGSAVIRARFLSAQLETCR